MKKIIPFFIFTLLLSCSSDDNSSSTPNTETNIKLTKIVETNLLNNTSQTINFTYSGNVLTKSEEIESTGDIYKTEFNYVNNKLQSLSYYDNGVLSGTNTFNYTGELITSSSSIEDNINFTHNYTYNTNNQMIKDAQYDDGVYNSEETFTYNSLGNISTHSHSAFSGVYSFEYDSQKNPYSLVYSNAVMKIYGAGFTKNNITKKTESNSSTISVYEYTYNENGYPTQIIEKVNGVSIEKTNFTYN